MTDIDTRIEQLQKEIAELEKTKRVGYEVETTIYEEYNLGYECEVIRTLDGDLAGIVIDQEIMTKYFESNPYK